MGAMTASAVGAGMMVDPLALVPPRISLLTSVDVTEVTQSPDDDVLVDPAAARDLEDALRWVNGIRFLPDNCAPPDNPYWWACPEGAGAAPTFQKTIPAAEDVVLYRPFDVWVGYRCSALQARQGADFVARANRAIEAWQSYIIARELWTGAYVATPSGFPNDFLENSPTLLNGGLATGYVAALAELEQALATCQPGQIGVIHAQPRTVTYWIQNGLVVPEAPGPNNRRLRTLLGTIVVPDAGYDGGGAAQGEGDLGDAYAYGTGMIRVWLGPIRRLLDYSSEPGDTAGLNPAEIERSQNTVGVRVERTAAAVWDECCQVGVRVNHTAAL